MKGNFIFQMINSHKPSKIKISSKGMRKDSNWGRSNKSFMSP